MNFSQAKVTVGLSAVGKHTSTDVSGNASLGDAAVTHSIKSANIVGVMKVVSVASGNVATLTLATLVAATTTGSPVISDGDGKDAEGVTFATLAKILGIRIWTDAANVGDVTVAGTNATRLPTGVLGPGEDICKAFPDDGQALSSATLTFTFAGAGQTVYIAVAGKSA